MGTGSSLDVDPAGNIYLTDENNCRIREVSATNGTIFTVAGSATCGYAGDGGAATSAQLNDPQRIQYSGRAGNFIISDTGNNVLRQISGGVMFPPTNVGASAPVQLLSLQTTAAIKISSITVLQSEGSKQEFSVGTITGCTVNGSTVNASGSVCVVPITFSPGYPGERLLSLIVTTSTGTATFPLNGLGLGPQVVLSPGTITTVAGTGTAGYTGDSGQATAATLKGSYKTAVDAQGNLYIADTLNNVVRKVTASTGAITTIAGSGTACAKSTATCGDGGQATAANLNAPSGIAMDGSGNLYIADRGDNRVRVLNTGTGVISTLAGTGVASYTGDASAANVATLSGPTALTVDQYGNLYIADTGNNAVREIEASSGIINTLAGSGTACVSSIAACGDGVAATAANLSAPAGIAIDSVQNIYIADTGDNRIRLVTASTGVISTVAGTGTAGSTGDGAAATSAKLNAPRRRGR